MKILLLALTLYASVLLIKSSVHADIPPKQRWTMKKALLSRAKLFNGAWISGNEILYLENDLYRISNVETVQDRYLISDQDLTILPPGADLTLFPSDNTKVLISYDLELTFRHSFKARYAIYDVITKNLVDIANRELVQFCIVSPTNNRIAYVLDNNVFIRQLDGNEYQITNDGQVGTIYNGIPDWVYEEEVLEGSSALWWSPDGEKLTMGHFDDMQVKTYKYFIYDYSATSDTVDNQYPKEYDLKYPKSGSTNPLVQLKVADIKNVNENNTANWKILNAPVNIVTEDHIMQSVIWSDADHVVVMWLNRRQNKGVIVSCDLNGQCQNILILEEPNGWLLAKIPQCLSDGKSCLMINWIGDWLQVWNLDLKTGENKWSSRGNFTVLEIYGYNENTNELYYQATLENDPIQKHVFKNNYCISCALTDADGDKCTDALAKFSNNLKYYALTCSGPNPAYTRIFRSQDDRAILNWEDNSDFRRLVSTKLMPKIEYLKIPVSGMQQATVKLYLPQSVNLSDPNPTESYPLIVNVYGGPNSNQVKSKFQISYSAYYVTQHNIIYADIDTRGSANRGKEYLMSVNNQLGHYEVDDVIYVTRYLQRNYKIFDQSRSGIWGWSYGGYVSSLVIARDNENVFKCGVGGAPVTAWKFYDSVYTERYMGLPTKEDNLANYTESEVTKNLDNFRTHQFLLVHGQADDNVHIQHSWILSKALQKANIDFEQLFYADESHGLGAFFFDFLNRMEHFFSKCLNFSNGGE